MTAAYFEDHPTDPEKMIMRKPPQLEFQGEKHMTDYDKVLQAIKEMRPVQNNPLVRENPPSWWLDRFEEVVRQLKEKNNG